MNLTESTLRSEELAVYRMRALFKLYGYSRFKMSKFEEYDLYVRNKEFLVSDRMITFTDQNGKLLALKPDVTMSIIKTTTGSENAVRKLYYNENVFRAFKGDRAFREIMQTGLECIGDIELYNTCEVILLAVKSLALISPDYVLDISHLGFVSGLLDAAGVPEDERSTVLKCVREKNAPELSALCDRIGLGETGKQQLLELVATYGEIGHVIGKLRDLCVGSEMASAYRELEGVYQMLREDGLEDRVRLDFSVVNDMDYYNGIVFQGFIHGVPSGVLSGGRYDRLMRKLGKSAGAVGFAVYLDELERLNVEGKQYDVDVLLLYRPDCDISEIMKAVEAYTSSGISVRAETIIPEKLKYRRLVNLEDWRRDIGQST